MTREEFKTRWESNVRGGGLTYNDVADCAIEWGITQQPKIQQMNKILQLVLKEAGIKEAN